jgi:hypothetical protein
VLLARAALPCVCFGVAAATAPLLHLLHAGLIRHNASDRRLCAQPRATPPSKNQQRNKTKTTKNSDAAIKLIRRVHPHTAAVLRSQLTSEGNLGCEARGEADVWGGRALLVA